MNLQGDHTNIEDLGTVVQHVKREYGVDFVYCWHALHAYWGGVSPTAAAVDSYGSQMTYPIPTPGDASMSTYTMKSEVTLKSHLLNLLATRTGCHLDLVSFFVKHNQCECTGAVNQLSRKASGSNGEPTVYHAKKLFVVSPRGSFACVMALVRFRHSGAGAIDTVEPPSGGRHWGSGRPCQASPRHAHLPGRYSLQC